MKGQPRRDLATVSQAEGTLRANAGKWERAWHTQVGVTGGQ